MASAIEQRPLILVVPLPEQRPDFAEYEPDLLLKRATVAGPMAQQPPIFINPFALDLPLVEIRHLIDLPSAMMRAQSPRRAGHGSMRALPSW